MAWGAPSPIRPHPSQFSESDLRKARFGFSENKAKGNDAAARAGVLSGGYKGGLELLPAEEIRRDFNEGPEGRDWQNRVTPTRAESQREDDYVNLQVQQGQEKEARLHAGIAQEQEMSARLQRQAAEQAFFDRTGLPYDPKLALKLAEFDQQAAEDEGFQIEMAAMTDREQELLSKSAPQEHVKIKAHFEKARKERLLLMAIRAGAGIGGAFNPQKASANDLLGLGAPQPES